jgi:predicted flap endonuclease-1-like 5' DNA nuclease
VITIEHVIEVALLILVAYLAGCVLGYGVRAAIRSLSGRPRFETLPAVQPASAVPAQMTAAAPQPATRSAARRLAGAVEREEATPAPSPPAHAAQRPAELPGPRGGKADDLKQIKGIGAKTESALNDLGVYHLDQIAAWSPANVDWLEGRIAVKGRIRREQWIEQAILLVTATKAA